MKQNIIENMPSPFGGGQSVLTLACGHLWSWKSPPEPPPQIDCIHCERRWGDGPFDTPELAHLDTAVRNLRRSRHGLGPLPSTDQ